MFYQVMNKRRHSRSFINGCSYRRQEIKSFGQKLRKVSSYFTASMPYSATAPTDFHSIAIITLNLGQPYTLKEECQCTGELCQIMSFAVWMNVYCFNWLTIASMHHLHIDSNINSCSSARIRPNQYFTSM